MGTSAELLAAQRSVTALVATAHEIFDVLRRLTIADAAGTSDSTLTEQLSALKVEYERHSHIVGNAAAQLDATGGAPKVASDTAELALLRREQQQLREVRV